MTGTRNWYGVKLTNTEGTSDKFWAIYISETGTLYRHWGSNLTGGAVNGKFRPEDYSSALEAINSISSVFKRKLADGYVGGFSAAAFTTDDDPGLPDYKVALAYHSVADETTGDSAPLDALRALIEHDASTRPTTTSPDGTTVTTARLSHPAEKSYPRPNGEAYFPRRVGGLHDVAMLRSARDTNLSVVLYGAPGCGKTALVEGAFPDCYTVVGSDSTDVEDLVGRYLPDPDRPGAYIWDDGPLTRAALEGKPFFADEIALINPEVLSVLYPLMDGRNEIHVPARPDKAGGSTVVAADGFYVVGAFNPYVPGARMSEAMWSRFSLKIEYTTDHKLCRTLGVPANAITVAVKLNSFLRDPNHELNWAPQTRELIRFKQISETFGTEFAVGNLIAECPLDARPVVEAVVRDVFSAPKAEALVTGGRA